MKLDKVTRHRLFAGETVQLSLTTPLRRDGVYAIHTDKGTRQGQFRVLVIRKGVAFIRYEGDPVRLLSQSGGDSEGHGYTDFYGRSMPNDPGEAVDEFTQRRITERSRERERESIGELFCVLEDLRSAVKERLEANPDAVRIMGRDAWALRNKIDAVERRLKRRQAA